jgi:hypothetical protein
METEGRSYSGALKYRQLCRSVVVSHKLQWIQHYHYLLSAEGPNQNYVEVERDFSDLDAAMEDLIQKPEKAKRIANNSVKLFRERYLTAAAEACYWRELVRAWTTVSDVTPKLYTPDAESEAKMHKMQKKVEQSARRRGVRYETFM